MRKRKAILLTYVAVFVLMLAAPIAAFNRVPGRISETENRYLATFPDIFDDAGHLNTGVKSGLETWLSDNLGFRSRFVEMATNIKLRLFHQSTSVKVEMGRDGWYFYTLDHNVQLATGEFTLTDEVLADIAAKQQRISDWYASQGIKYLLVLTASKASVYPEYIASGSYGVRETPCDQLEAYLKEHTTVNVVNCKTELLKHKDEGKLYLKTDTHHTQLGSYYAYQAIAEKLRAMGETVADIPVSFSEMQIMGEFSDMLGASGILGEETVPKAEWQSNITPVDSGPVYEELLRMHQSDSTARAYPVVIYENATAPNGTLLIYGDSQWDTIRCLPVWLGENYQNLVLTRLRYLTQAVDELVQPDTVIYSCGERYIDTVLRKGIDIPELADGLPDLPQATMITREEYGNWVGNEGICLDTYNDRRLEESTTIQIDPAAASVKLYGWAADFRNDAPFSELYLQVGDTLMKCDYNIERTSVADHFQKDSLLMTGFEITFPASCLKDGQVTEVSFIGVSADGQYLYEPVTYQLHY